MDKQCTDTYCKRWGNHNKVVKCDICVQCNGKCRAWVKPGAKKCLVCGDIITLRSIATLK